jgi:hypothetical protein
MVPVGAEVDICKKKRGKKWRPPSPERPLICFMMQTPVLFYIDCLVTWHLKTKAEFVTPPGAEAQKESQSSTRERPGVKSLEISFDAQRVVKRNSPPETGVQWSYLTFFFPSK